MTALLNRVATALDRRLSRRGFLARSALAGTAMAVAPTDYLLKPVGAYQAICTCRSGCDCNSTCCDGYTEFCCTMTGLNRCPPGHILGGWWKVDNSQFCGDAPRYFMDCNAPCNGCGCDASGICSGSCSGTTCGCALNSCNNRKAGCVAFRYGQCNQATRCIGPIACRVVTCIPPWSLDSTCTREVAIDDYTRYHIAPCLYRPYGWLDQVSPVAGGFRLRGWAADPETTGPIDLHIYVDGRFVQRVLANRPRPDLAGPFPGIGINHGFEAVVPMGPGRYNVTVYAINVLDGSEQPVIGSAPVGVGQPFGYADLQIGPAKVRAIGWVIDPDHTTPAAVQAYVDGTLVGTWDANVYRSDVAAIYSSYGGEHGFDIQIPMPEGTHLIELRSPDLDGVLPSFPLASQRVTIANTTPIGWFDGAMRSPAGIRVRGWAADYDRAEPLDIHAYVDGVFAGLAKADRPRPDVPGVFPAFGPSHGFDFEVPAQPGIRQVNLYAINKPASTAINPLLGSMTVVVGNLPFGWLDEVSDHPGGARVRGWAIDPNVVGPVDLHVYIDGVFAGLGRTGTLRPDVEALYPGYGGWNGFEFVVPATAGRRLVCVYAINVGDSSVVNPLFGCIPVTLT